jgi:hypothetical protein
MHDLIEKFNLAIIILEERDGFVAYVPALATYASASTAERAKKKAISLVNSFFNSFASTDALINVLGELGWDFQDGHPVPPKLLSHSVETFHVHVTDSLPAPGSDLALDLQAFMTKWH